MTAQVIGSELEEKAYFHLPKSVSGSHSWKEKVKEFQRCRQTQEGKVTGTTAWSKKGGISAAYGELEQGRIRPWAAGSGGNTHVNRYKSSSKLLNHKDEEKLRGIGETTPIAMVD